MTSNLFKLLAAVVVTILAGFLCYPLGEKLLEVMNLRDSMANRAQADVEAARQARLRQQEENRKLVHSNRPTRPRGIVIADTTANDDWQKGFEEGEDDVTTDAPPQDTTLESDDSIDNGAERDFSSYMLADCDPDLVGITEDKDAPEIAGQSNVVPKAPDSKVRNSYAAAIRKYISALEKDAKGAPYNNPEFKGTEWKKPNELYEKLEERVLAKLGQNPTAESVMEYLKTPENRRDLALITLIRRAGIKDLEEVSGQRGGITVLNALSSDLGWLCNTLYSGPSGGLGKGLQYMAQIFSRYSEDINNETARRIATTTATEFAREGWSKKDMMERFSYYYGSHREGRLNKIFDTLAYWETRIVTGNNECRSWGSPASLAWQRDNVRLPVEGYLGASGQLVYRLRNVAGDSVFSGEYLAPVMKRFNNITALAHREIGGVCGACSHYGAYGALAAGIPAMTMGEPGHCAYAVRVGNEWKKGYSIYWQHGMHKTFWGLHDWEFLILTQDLYSDATRTLASDQLAAMADFLASKRMTKAAFNCFDAAVQMQPLNWPAWLAYAGFLKQKSPENKERWVTLCNDVINTLAEKYHNVAATFQARYIYPNLLPLIPDKKERNKLFAAFFKKCEDFGINRWDVTPLLNAQFAGCKTEAEKLDYMKTALSILMAKSDYSGSVLTWGLEMSGKMGEANGQGADRFQEEFSKLITSAMKRMRSGKKDRDSTWAGLGEAIHTAATNGDNYTFQAIGKLAMQKCKKHFPKNRFKFRGFSGRIVSAKGSIRTGVTLDDNALKQSCLHWGVLQKNGGVIPIKFEGNTGITVKLEASSDLNGVVALFDCAIKNDRPFRIEASEDGQNWEDTGGKVEIDGSIMRVDLRSAQASARYVRLLREGDKWDTGNIVGFYVYGKLKKNS